LYQEDKEEKVAAKSAPAEENEARKAAIVLEHMLRSKIKKEKW
jgi:hypothetical protein